MAYLFFYNKCYYFNILDDAQMRYIYMPTEIAKASSKCEVWGSNYAINSNERTLDFSNQYNERFMLAPRKTIYIFFIGNFIIGFILRGFI